MVIVVGWKNDAELETHPHLVSEGFQGIDFHSGRRPGGTYGLSKGLLDDVRDGKGKSSPVYTALDSVGADKGWLISSRESNARLLVLRDSLIHPAICRFSPRL